MCPRAERLDAWSRLARDLDLTRLDGLVEEVALPDVVATSERLLAGKVRGRVVVPVAPRPGET